MKTAATPQLSHMGIMVRDLPVQEKFYTRVFRMLVSDRGVGHHFKREIVFLTADERQHHQLVLAAGRGPDDASTIFQMSFKVQSLEDLRAIRDQALAAGATNVRGLNHGNAWSVYFHDPEQNLVEVYLDTPFHVPQPHGDALDLSQSDEQIVRDTEAMCRRDPGFMMMADYMAATAARIRGSPAAT